MSCGPRLKSQAVLVGYSCSTHQRTLCYNESKDSKAYILHMPTHATTFVNHYQRHGVSQSAVLNNIHLDKMSHSEV